MGIKKGKTDYLLSLIREGKRMTLGQQLRLTAYLSVPAIMAQVSSIAMQYIDASMVGSLGANAAASIGLVSTTTWLFWGLCAAAATGFSVQVAHRIGAGDFAGAKKILRQSVTATLVFSSLLAVVGISISGVLPGWLGGDEMIRSDSSFYFRIFSLFLPALQLNFLAGGMLRCSGNMRVPSMLNVLMCFWDVVFNFFLIFPTRQVDWWGWEFIVPGVGLGVEGAVLGTVLAELITAGGMMWYLCRRSSMLRLSGGQGSFLPRKETLRQAVRISLPMGFEHIAICGAQIMTTVIVAPLGIVAIAANSFAIIAESLCYMPGYGISEAATTLVGQSLGANRIRLLKRFANITVWSGMLIMGRVRAEKMLLVCATGTVVTTSLVLLNVGMISLAALLCGYAFEAIMFPTIFALSLRGLGNHTKRASSFLMMSPVGGVVGPLLMGLVADHTTMVWAFIVPLVAYCVVWAYARKMVSVSTASSI